jgi:hypothetical protein
MLVQSRARRRFHLEAQQHGCAGALSREGNTPLTYEDAKFRCHVRSAIYSASKPELRFWKNHPEPLDARVPDDMKARTDWAEFDPEQEAYEKLA